MNKRIAITIVAAMALLLALLASPVYGGNNGLERAKEVQERHTDELLAIQGVVGTAVGHGPEARAAVFVFTAKRGVAGIPKKLDGVPVVTHVTGEIFAFPKPDNPGGGKKAKDEVDPTARFDRPVPIGVSTGHPVITAGTIRVRVTDGTDVYALSNNHVYADENQAGIGDAVIQPGTFDWGFKPGRRHWHSIRFCTYRLLYFGQQHY